MSDTFDVDEQGNVKGLSSRTVSMPAEVRLAIKVLLNHIQPGWENCASIVAQWVIDTENQQ